MQQILVTGGAGYIGSHTVLALHKAGYQAVIVDSFMNSSPTTIEKLQTLTQNQCLWYKVDCTQKEALRQVFAENNIAAVIHFAALKAVGESVEKPNEYYYNNLVSLLNVLALMQEYGVKKIIFSSSATVYGLPTTLPVSETTPLQAATNPYGATKQMGERMIADCQKAWPALQAVILRYFNPIGADPVIGFPIEEKPNNLMPYIHLVATKKLPFLTIFGNDYDTPDGTCIRDYIDVRDLAIAHLQSLTFLENNFLKDIEIFNIGVSKGYSVLECVHAFERPNGVKIPYIIGSRRSGDVPVLYADTKKAEQILGFQPRYNLAESLLSLS